LKGSDVIGALLMRGLDCDDSEAKQQRLKDLFRTWDTDRCNALSKDELQKILLMLNPSFLKKDLDAAFKNIVTDGRAL
jgi:Ca2+-binding EF-hand superfamily protein